MEQPDFSLTSVEVLYQQLSGSIKGLSAEIAAERMRSQSRFNKQESRFKKEVKLFIRQFTNPLVFLLVIAVVLSAMLGESSDSIMILIILLTTGVFGFLQEVNAGRAMEKLRSMIEMKHTIIREGIALQLNTGQIVKGDILIFDAGDIIPADCRIIESKELHVDESSLTGESFPVEKMPGSLKAAVPLSKKYNCLWQGTSVISGTATAIAVYTGRNTIFGRMAHSLVQTPETAFEKGIKRFGFFLLRITLVLTLIILVVNLYFKKPFFDSILFSLALAVGMTPELLPAIMTFAMSAGAKRMFRKKVIVKKLSSIFNLGEVNVLCTDKTGTLTEGNVIVKDIVDTQGNSNERIRLFAYLNAVLQQGFSNPIDKGIAALSLNIDGHYKINEIPYDFIRKRLSVAVENNGVRWFITKGAFYNVLEVCSEIETSEETKMALDDVRRTKLKDQFVAYSQQGYRVLGLAYKKIQDVQISREDENKMTFLGFILLEDALKESTMASVNRLRGLGIEAKIITGDNRFAALHIATKIGIQETAILTGEEISQLSPESLVIKARQAQVFAEIEPHQKELIVKALQKSHLTIAYLGDGINDVAAINAADIGISTNNATDVARAAADFVFLEKDLSVLADGVLEGRKSFANSMKYVFINTGSIFGNMFSVAAASLFLPFLPMLPKQILLTNLLSDLPFLCIAWDRVDKDELGRPGKWDLRMVRHFMIVFGLHSSVFDFITFFILYISFHLSGSYFQTGWFVESVITELLIVYVIRTKGSFIKSVPGKWLMLASLAALVFTIILPYLPFASLFGLSAIPLRQLLIIGCVLLAYIVTADIVKMIFFRIHSKGMNKRTAS